MSCGIVYNQHQDRRGGSPTATTTTRTSTHGNISGRTQQVMVENAVDHGINSNSAGSGSSSTVRKNQFHRYQEHTARMRSNSRGESLTRRQREHSQINAT